MMKSSDNIIIHKNRHLVPVLILFFIFSLFAAAQLAAQGNVVAQEPVDIIVQSAFILFLQIGSSGSTIDTVSFSVSGLPGTGQVQGVSSGQNPVRVQAQAQQLHGWMILTADSSVPLNDGSGNTISFTQISWDGTGIMPDDTFSGTTNQLLFSTRNRNVQGRMTFYYGNTVYVPASTYTGRVTYTLSSP